MSVDLFNHLYFFPQIDLLSSRLSEKLVLHVLKFVGAEIESSKHIGFYAQWSHFILMHHGLWIRRKWKELLPVLNQLQKGMRQYKKHVKLRGHITYIFCDLTSFYSFVILGLTGKVADLSELCDRNEQTVNFLLTMAKLKKDRKIQKLAKKAKVISDDQDEILETGSDDEEMEHETVQGELENLQAKWSDEDAD